MGECRIDVRPAVLALMRRCRIGILDASTLDEVEEALGVRALVSDLIGVFVAEAPRVVTLLCEGEARADERPSSRRRRRPSRPGAAACQMADEPRQPRSLLGV